MAHCLDRSAYSANMYVNERLSDKDYLERLIRCFTNDRFTSVYCRAVEVGELRACAALVYIPLVDQSQMLGNVI